MASVPSPISRTSGNTYTDPNTGITYQYDGSSWVPISSGISQTPQTQAPISGGTFGSVLGDSTYQPSSGGQPSGGDLSGGTSQPQTDPYLESLRAEFGNLRSLYEGQIPQLESDYQRVRGDVEGSVGRAKETLGEQKQDIGVRFGESLRDLLLSDRELGQKSRNVYSGLNALDSSSFAEAENRRGQQLIETKGKLGVEKDRSLKQADRTYADYEARATDSLANLGNQYLDAKTALQTAISQNNLDEASAIQNYIQQIQQQAQQIQSVLLNLGQLQASGTDVIGNLQGLNNSGINQVFGNYLSNYFNPTSSRLGIPSPGLTGSGFIGSGGDDDRLRRLYQR